MPHPLPKKAIVLLAVAALVLVLMAAVAKYSSSGRRGSGRSHPAGVLASSSSPFSAAFSLRGGDSDAALERPLQSSSTQAPSPPDLGASSDFGGDEQSGNGTGSQRSVDCVHGTWDATESRCHCYDGWGTSGVTDTVNFLAGICEQYHCESAETCAEHLGISDARCPVRGWNCYCGWSYAFDNLGTGYETAAGQRGGGKCMGVMYTFSAWTTYTCLDFLERAWRVFVTLAMLVVPFGCKRAHCDHHRPSMWNWIRRAVGFPSSCQGECVMRPHYTLDTLKDDVAWSLYILEIGVWSYLFVFCLWVIAVALWSILLVALLVIAALCALVCGAMAACGDAAGGAGCDCFCCCDGGPGPCEGADCAGCCPEVGGGAAGGADLSAGMLVGGPYPYYDPCWFGGFGPTYVGDCSGCGRCDCECCRWPLCRPIALLIYVFPVAPENLWGGIVGYFFLGTHQLTPAYRLYGGGSRVVEWMRMGWRRRHDLHDNDSWRLQVYNFLTQDGDEGRVMASEEAYLDSALTSNDEMLQPFLEDGSRTTRRLVQIGHARAICVGRQFDQDADDCVPSSFEDYKSNTCWICRDANDEWDLWLSCHHLFCKTCSQEMLRRRMPCPLCRVASSTVIRGRAWPQPEPVEPDVPGSPVSPDTPAGDDIDSRAVSVVFQPPEDPQLPGEWPPGVMPRSEHVQPPNRGHDSQIQQPSQEPTQVHPARPQQPQPGPVERGPQPHSPLQQQPSQISMQQHHQLPQSYPQEGLPAGDVQPGRPRPQDPQQDSQTQQPVQEVIQVHQAELHVPPPQQQPQQQHQQSPQQQPQQQPLSPLQQQPSRISRPAEDAADMRIAAAEEASELRPAEDAADMRIVSAEEPRLETDLVAGKAASHEALQERAAATLAQGDWDGRLESALAAVAKRRDQCKTMPSVGNGLQPALQERLAAALTQGDRDGVLESALEAVAQRRQQQMERMPSADTNLLPTMLPKRVAATLAKADADGRLEVALKNVEARRYAFNMTPSVGTWYTPTMLPKRVAATLAKADADGRLEIALKNVEARRHAFNMTPSVGTWYTPTMLPKRVAATLAKADADGRLEIALKNVEARRHAFNMTPSVGTWYTPALLQDREAATLAKADVDGRLEVALQTVEARRRAFNMTPSVSTWCTPALLHRRVAATLLQADADGHLESVLQGVQARRRALDVSPSGDTWSTQVRQQAANTLTQGASDGRLEVALQALAAKRIVF